jgi:hypothetical protein
MRLIDILKDLARTSRSLTFDESAYVEAIGTRLRDLRPSGKAQLLMAEGLTPDAIEHLNLDDDLSSTLTFLFRQGAH